MQSVEITAEDVEPPDTVPDLPTVAKLTLSELNIADYEIGIVICSDDRIAALNQTYRGISGPTDVLTFSQNEGESVPAGEDEAVRGDIVVSIDQVRKNAHTYRVDSIEELFRVIVHGVLHLCGYAHEGVKLGDQGTDVHPMFSIQEGMVSRMVKEMKR